MDWGEDPVVHCCGSGGCRLYMLGVEDEIIERRKLLGSASHPDSRGCTHLFDFGVGDLWVLHCDMLDDELRCFEQLIAFFASILARLFLLDQRCAQLPGLPSKASAPLVAGLVHSLLDVSSAVLNHIDFT